MLRVYKDAILIPYAVEVDNQIISLYDPVVHQRIENDDPDMDPRWIVCKRPASWWAANWCPACWNCAWTNLPASMRLPCR